MRKRLSTFLRAALVFGWVLVLALPQASSQTTTLPNFTAANTPLTGAEVVWGNQPGVGANGTVKISIPSIAAYTCTVYSCGGGGSGVSSFNGRTGSVSLQSTDVTGALGFTPLSSTSGIGVLASPNTWTGQNIFNGGVALNYPTYNSSQTISILAGLVCGDVSGGAITLTMPPGTGSGITNGTPIPIKDCKRLSGTNHLTIAANTGQTIEGAASIVLSTNGASINPVWNSVTNNWDLF